MTEIDVRHYANLVAMEFALEEVDKLDEFHDHMDDIAYKAAVEAKEFWSEEAGRMLNSTRLQYQQSLEIYEDYSTGSVVVGMNPDAKLAIAIEEGAPAYDMKPGFLKGVAAKVIPINPPRDMRVATAGQGDDKWKHPGFRGLDIASIVNRRLENVIIPRHLNELFDSL